MKELASEARAPPAYVVGLATREKDLEGWVIRLLVEILDRSEK